MLWVSVFVPSRHVTSRKAHDDNVPDTHRLNRWTSASPIPLPHTRVLHRTRGAGKGNGEEGGRGEELDNVLFDYSA